MRAVLAALILSACAKPAVDWGSLDYGVKQSEVRPIDNNNVK